MTKEELKAKLAEQQNIIENANNQIRSDMMEYIKSLPFKVGDKISCEWYDAGLFQVFVLKQIMTNTLATLI